LQYRSGPRHDFAGRIDFLSFRRILDAILKAARAS
jgi:hypothetical protein